MNFYHDQVVAGGEAGVPLPPAHRMIFVRHGRVRVGDVVLDSGDSLFAPDEMIVTSEVDKEFKRAFRHRRYLRN